MRVNGNGQVSINSGSSGGYNLNVNGTSYFNNTQTATSNVHVASDANTNLHINGATHSEKLGMGQSILKIQRLLETRHPMKRLFMRRVAS